MNRKAWLLAAASLVAGMAQATCYTVYKSDGALLLESSTTPVNLSLPIGDTVPEKFGPGATMTVSDHSIFCRDQRDLPAMKKSLAEAVRAEGEKAQQVAAARQDAAAKVEEGSAAK
jgi:hypothetical protein